MNRWYGANQSGMTSLNEVFLRAEEHPSADSLRQVKDAYLATFPQLGDLEKRPGPSRVFISAFEQRRVCA
jgi:hypothetical protein